MHKLFLSIFFYLLLINSVFADNLKFQCEGFQVDVINSTLINQLIENYNPSDNKSIIIPTYKNKKGNPVLIDREFFPDILSIKGDKGAKDIIKVNKKYINEIPQKQSAIINDIDTKEDLAKYIKGSHDN